MGGIGQTRFPVRADRPEVAHLALVTGVGVDRVGLGGNSDPTLRLCSIGDSACLSLLFPILWRRWECIFRPRFWALF